MWPEEEPCPPEDEPVPAPACPCADDPVCPCDDMLAFLLVYAAPSAPATMGTSGLSDTWPAFDMPSSEYTDDRLAGNVGEPGGANSDLNGSFGLRRELYETARPPSHAAGSGPGPDDGREATERVGDCGGLSGGSTPNSSSELPGPGSVMSAAERFAGCIRDASSPAPTIGMGARPTTPPPASSWPRASPTGLIPPSSSVGDPRLFPPLRRS